MRLNALSLIHHATDSLVIEQAISLQMDFSVSQSDLR